MQNLNGSIPRATSVHVIVGFYLPAANPRLVESLTVFSYKDASLTIFDSLGLEAVFRFFGGFPSQKMEGLSISQSSETDDAIFHHVLECLERLSSSVALSVRAKCLEECIFNSN